MRHRRHTRCALVPAHSMLSWSAGGAKHIHRTFTIAVEVMQAMKNMHEFASTKVEKLSELTATPTSQLKMVADAWAQVRPCNETLSTVS